MSAATPGWLRMPAPTSETLAIDGSTSTPCAARPGETSSAAAWALSRTSLGTVKLMSVCPAVDTFWTIMSTSMSTAANAPNSLAATPG